jgi:hypothetical protein
MPTCTKQIRLCTLGDHGHARASVFFRNLVFDLRSKRIAAETLQKFILSFRRLPNRSTVEALTDHTNQMLNAPSGDYLCKGIPIKTVTPDKTLCRVMNGRDFLRYHTAPTGQLSFRPFRTRSKTSSDEVAIKYLASKVNRRGRIKTTTRFQGSLPIVWVTDFEALRADTGLDATRVRNRLARPSNPM